MNIELEYLACKWLAVWFMGSLALTALVDYTIRATVKRRGDE